MKKFLLVCFNILLVASVVCSVVFGCLWNNAQHDLDENVQIEVINELKETVSSLEEEVNEYMLKYSDASAELAYTKDQLAKIEEEKNQLVVDIGIKQNRIDEITGEVSNLQSQLADKQSELETAINDKNQSQENVTNLTNQVNTLQGQISTLQEEKNTLQNEVDEKNATITTLNGEKANLLSQVNSLQTQLNEKAETIQGLNAQILELQTQIASYMENYQPADTEKYAVVVFEFKDEFYGAQIVEKGSYVMIKEPTSTDRVTFNYWKLNNEEFDIANTPVTSNMTLTADCSFKYEVKFVTVDDQGVETVVSTQLIDSGDILSTPETPVKEGYAFDYWTIDGVNEFNVEGLAVQQDYKFIAHFTKNLPTFAYSSWDEIAQVSLNGTAQDYFNVGDEREITLSTGEKITVVILGFNHDDLSDGTGKAGMSIGMKDCLKTKYKMNSTDTNDGGWNASLMRTETMVTLLSQLPSDLQTVIKEVNKKTSAGNTSSDIVYSSDKLWLFSEVEIDGTTNEIYANEGTQYEYWRTIKDGTNPDHRLKKSGNSSQHWWLRSPRITLNTAFHCINSFGAFTMFYGSNSQCVSFGFCV